MAYLVFTIQITLLLFAVGYDMTPKERSRKGAGEIVGNSLMFIGDSQVFYGEAMPYGFLKILRDQIVLIDAGTVRFVSAS